MLKGGDLFLDEIGDLPLPVQSKLLRVIQENTFCRIGAEGIDINSSARLIFATWRNLEELVEKDQFREDLYSRINVVKITIPPLRKRISDLPFLWESIFRKKRKDLGAKVEEYDPAILEDLKEYHWPGNIRELENLITRTLTYNIKKRIIQKTDLIWESKKEFQIDYQQKDLFSHLFKKRCFIS